MLLNNEDKDLKTIKLLLKLLKKDKLFTDNMILIELGYTAKCRVTLENLIKFFVNNNIGFTQVEKIKKNSLIFLNDGIAIVENVNTGMIFYRQGNKLFGKKIEEVQDKMKYKLCHVEYFNHIFSFSTLDKSHRDLQLKFGEY